MLNCEDPDKEEDRLAGIHSGALTLLRKAQPGDRFYQPNTFIVQYVATYKFNDLPKRLEEGSDHCTRAGPFSSSQPDRLRLSRDAK